MRASCPDEVVETQLLIGQTAQSFAAIPAWVTSLLFSTRVPSWNPSSNQARPTEWVETPVAGVGNFGTLVWQYSTRLPVENNGCLPVSIFSGYT